MNWNPVGIFYTSALQFQVCYLLTYSMVQDIIWKADSHSAFQKYPILFMEPEGSLPCPQ
jgi:hypothetical protein